MQFVLGKNDIGGWGDFFFGAFQLCPQRFPKCSFVRTEGAQIDLVAPRNIFRQVFDLHLQLRLAHLPMAAFFLQLAERIAQAAQFGFPFLHCPEPNGTLGRDFVRGRFRFGCARGLFPDRNFSVAVFLCLRRELAFVTGDIGPAGRN